MTIDLISDMVTRLRNAAIINKKLISLPFNKNNYIIIKILEREGYIFCSTFINNKDKLFLKLLELIFIKKNFSYNDTRVKNLLFFIRNFVKIHQHPENIKKYSKSEKKTLSFLNTIDDNLIKGENFSDPMSSLISKFKDSYIKHKKVKSNNSGNRQSIFKNQELPMANSKIDTISFKNNDLQIDKDLLNNMDVNFSINHLSTSTIKLKQQLNEVYYDLKQIRAKIKSDDTGSNLARFFAAASQIDKSLEDMYTNLNKLNESFSNSSSLVRETVFEKDDNKSENIISNLTNFQKSLDETHSLIPMSTNFQNTSKNININDLEFSLTKLNKYKDDINSYLFYLSKNTDDLQFYLKRSYQQVAKLNLNLRTNKYPDGSVVRASQLVQKDLKDIKYNVKHELNKNLDDIIFYLTKLAKMLNTITSTFNFTELKKYFGIKSMQTSTGSPLFLSPKKPSFSSPREEERTFSPQTEEKTFIQDFPFSLSFLGKKEQGTRDSSFPIEKRLFRRYSANQKEELKKKELKQNSFFNQHTSDDIDLKSYISDLPAIKLELKNNLDFVTSKFSELKQNFNDFKSMQTSQNSPRSSILGTDQQVGKEEEVKKEKRVKEIFDSVDSILTHLPAHLFEFSDNVQIDDINSYISSLSAAMIELNDIQLNFNDFSHFSSSFAPYSANKNREFVNEEILTNTKENVNFTDQPLKINERLRKLKKRLKPEEKITYDPIQGKNSFLPFAFNKNGDSINSSISPLEKKEYTKPLNLQKYLRKKNNKTFQTLFNPNYSKIILLALNLNAKEKSSIHGIRRISKPSLRCYSSNPIPRSFGGLGVFIVSTNCGIMTDNEAREKKLGGEIMLEIW